VKLSSNYGFDPRFKRGHIYLVKLLCGVTCKIKVHKDSSLIGKGFYGVMIDRKEFEKVIEAGVPLEEEHFKEPFEIFEFQIIKRLKRRKNKK